MLMMYTVLVNKGKDEQISIQNSQICFDKIKRWCNLNRLTLNQAKTKHLCIMVEVQNIDNISTFKTNIRWMIGSGQIHIQRQ